MVAPSLEELREIAIAREPDRYYAATLAPRALRYDLITLAAFAAELSRIPGMVREPLAGEIRLQWWRDALTSAGEDAVAGHPVAMATRTVIARFALPQETIEAIIDDQGNAVHGERPVDEVALRGRMAAGEGGLFRLAARICGGDGDVTRLAEAAGLAYGLSRTLARVPFEGVAVVPIPLSLLAIHGLGADGDGDARGNPAVASALQALVAMAREAMSVATADFAHMPRRQRLAFLPLVMVRPNLHALQTWLERPEGSTATEPLSIGRLVRIGWAHASGRL